MRALPLLTGLLLAVGLTACGARDPEADTDRLSRILPLLQQFRVEAYRNQDWCKNIAYRQGKFSNNRESNTCNRFDGTPQPFTDQAGQTFDQIATALEQTRVPLYAIQVKYAPDGTIRQVEFRLANSGGYLYHPGYKFLPTSLANELEYKAVNQDWYRYWQDWN